MNGAGHLGITVGNTRSVAVHRARAEDEPTVVVLPTTLRFDEDGRAHLGEPADLAPFTRFVDLVGRQENLDPDADAYRAEDLMANAANCLITMVSAASESGEIPVTTMTYPTRWPRDSVALLRDALDHTGLTAVALVPDAKAASTFAQQSPGSTATVIDIGATGTDISTYPGGGTVRTTAVSGDVFTDALLDHVVTDPEQVDMSDAAVLAALADVVASCEAAKHALSAADDATISVELPGLSQTTTVTRAELADLIAPALGTLELPQTGTVVLTGGSAALPPVAAEIAQRSSGHVVVEPIAATRGALLLAEIEDVDGNSLVTGAAPIITRDDGNDSLDTDAIPVVSPEKSLAFSEAIPAVAPIFEPSEFRSQPIYPAEESAPIIGAAALAPRVVSTKTKKERSERSRTITTVIAGAAAGVVIVLAIAALSGVFGTAPAPTPPTVTDAGSLVITSTRTPSTTTVTPAPPVLAPEVVEEPTYEPYIPPQPAPVPAPVPAPPPVPIPTTEPVVPTTTPAVTTTAVTTTPAETTTTPAATTTTTSTTTDPAP